MNSCYTLLHNFTVASQAGVPRPPPPSFLPPCCGAKLDFESNYSPFRQSISIWDIPDYLDNIVIPMNLQTVGERLEVGHYATPTDFVKDVSLKTRRATTTPTENRDFSQWLVDSRSSLKNIFVTFWLPTNGDKNSFWSHGQRPSKKTESISRYWWKYLVPLTLSDRYATKVRNWSSSR